MKALNQLSNAERRFILHWGEMGTKWGINRTVAQVHALLYLAPEGPVTVAGNAGGLRVIGGYRLLY